MRSGKILVVGATGRVGSAAVERLLEAGFEVRALVRRPEKGARLRSLGAETVVGDATTPDTLGPAVEGCAGVFSALGAGPGRGGPRRSNTRATSTCSRRLARQGASASFT